MNSQKYIDQMKAIHHKFLKYIDAETLNENKFQKFYSLIQENGFIDDKIKFKSILRMIKIIADNHRSNDLYPRVQKTLLFFRDTILKTFKNLEIYSIFETNRKITLFLIKSNIITIDEPITHRIIKRNDIQFFYPEIKPFVNYNTALYSTLELFPKSGPNTADTNVVIYSNSSFFTTDDMRNLKKAVNQEEIKNFEEKRQIGENDSYICSLIRKDSIKEFITYINQTNLSLSSLITPSSFETNSFLLKNNETTLIEYAAFFGAIQIFKYLYMNGVKLTPSLWYYVIHGRNLELIQFLEDNKINPNFKKVFNESIKCHHNEIANYILDNFTDDFFYHSNMKYLKYFNFEFVHNDYYPIHIFCILCKYNQTTLLELLSKIDEFDVNERSFGGFGIEEITLLSYAIINDNTEMAKFLLSYENIDVNILSYFPTEKRKECFKYPKSSIFLAIEKENVEIVRDLIKRQNIEIDVNSAFKLALELNNTEIAKLILLCHNININNQWFDYTYPIKAGGEKTLLSLAIEYENTEVVKFLLTFNDLDINQYSIYYRYGFYHKKITPLALAIEKSNIEIIKLLLSSSKLNINLSSEYYINGKLSEMFCNPIDKKFGKISPLFMAIDKENIKIIKLLLSHEKINVYFTTMYREFNDNEYKYKTLLDFASEKQNNEINELLKAFKPKNYKKINIPTFGLPNNGQMTNEKFMGENDGHISFCIQ